MRYRNKFPDAVLDTRYPVVFRDGKDLDYVYIIAKKLIRCNVCSNRFSPHYRGDERLVKTLFYSVKFMTPICSEECHIKMWEDYHKIAEQQQEASRTLDNLMSSPVPRIGGFRTWP